MMLTIRLGLKVAFNQGWVITDTQVIIGGINYADHPNGLNQYYDLNTILNIYNSGRQNLLKPFFTMFH